MKNLILATLLISSLLLIDGRSFTLVNECPHTVWFGFVSGAESPRIAPDDNNYELAPNGRKTVAIPDITWSGVIAGRTDCTDSGCVTADCGGGKGACPHGFQPPATQAEFTLIPQGTDYYDVEIINGINIPVSITPTVGSQASNPYLCGSPGARNPSPGLAACSWNLRPPLNEYKWVENSGKSCSSDTDCGAGTVCGLSFNPGFQQLLQIKCGKLLGYWTADQICGIQRDYAAPFHCSDPVPGQESITWWHLMACVAVDTCYKDGAAEDCCGCVDWDEEGLPVPSDPITEKCKNKNSNWVNTIKPTLRWLKEACPTAYVYPYDDKSSTYTCNSMENGNNDVSYSITFCPGGASVTASI